VSSVGLKREQRKLLTDRLNSARRVDATLEDLRTQSWGKLGHPVASDTYALWQNYPARHEPLVDDIDHRAHDLGITVDADAFAAAHCKHCPMCAQHESLHPACYGTLMCHSLKFGWRFPLTSKPPVKVFKNYKSIHQDDTKQPVIDKLRALDDYGVFTPGSPTLPINTSTVPLQAVVREKDSIKTAKLGVPLKVRVCLDFSKNLNDFAPDWKFRYAGLESVVPMLSKGCYIAILDLEKFFLQLPTHRSRWQFQHFFDPATQQFRAYRRCPFGFKLTPAFASAISSEVCAILRHLGVRQCSCFIDDIIIVNETKEGCQQDLDTALATLKVLGLPVQPSKVISPTQKAEYLGVEIDTVNCLLRISQERQERLLRDVVAALKSSRLHKHGTQVLLGRLNWLASVMPGARPYMRRLWSFLTTLPPRGWRNLTDGCIADLKWWRQRLADPAWTGSRIWPSDDALPLLTMKSDASGDGGCGYYLGDEFRTYVWNDQEREHSIAWKELFPVLLACKEFGHTWQGKIIRCGIDNAGAVYMLNSGSAGQPDCADLLRQIADYQLKYDFDIVATWVPREFNEAADSLSRNNVVLAQAQAKEEIAIHRKLQLPTQPRFSIGSHAKGLWRPPSRRPCRSRHSRT